MRELNFGAPIHRDEYHAWVENCFRQIEQATLEDIQKVVEEYTVTGTITPTRTFNAATATATDLRNVLATLIDDIQKQGQKRSYAA